MIVPLRVSRHTESVFHVTVLSNFARAYDKYRRQYRKAQVPESTYPSESYVLEHAELAVGIRKASGLLQKLGIPGNALVALEARLPREALRPRPRGLGLVWPSPDLPVHAVHHLVSGELSQTTPEELMASSLLLQADTFKPYSRLIPRSVSFLPIARGCQAACPFCFSDGSASLDQSQARVSWPSIERWVTLARLGGAERAVITGGGEPTLLGWEDLISLVRQCARGFEKVVLISNGFTLATAAAPVARLRALREAGLSVLAVSRHHADDAANARLMKLETQTLRLLDAHHSARGEHAGLRLRLVCVLQRGGVESVQGVDDYVAWAAAAGADEVCFKELYVSTSLESLYHSKQSNDFSAGHQISLEVVLAWAAAGNFSVVAMLPWGAPIFEAVVAGRRIRVAAYTEPSLFWERANGIARSWNVMADGTCLASLEDRKSVVAPSDVGGGS